MNKHIILLLLIIAVIMLTAGCNDEAKITKVQQTVIPNCQGKTMQDLASGLLETPVWSLVKDTNGAKRVTLSGTIIGDKLPAWMKDQKLMDITFSFALDPKTETFDPASLDGFPSLSSPEGVFQAYKIIVCQ